MATIAINKFDGGIAEDVRNFSTDQCEESLNFDIFSKPNLLQPYSDMVAQTTATGTITDYKIADVVAGATGITGLSTDGLIALGQAGAADTNLKFFSKSIDTSGDWNLRVEDTAGSVTRGTLVVYKTLAYAVGNSRLLEMDTATNINDRGAVGTVTCKPFVHPEDNILYGASGSTVWKWDGTTLTTLSSLIPTNMSVVSLTNYGAYLVIGCRENNGYGKAIAYLWGRDTSLNTLQGIVDFGIGNLGIVENLNDVLCAVMTTSNSGLVKDNKLTVKLWAGGQILEAKTIDIDKFETWSGIPTKAKRGEHLYFAMGTSDAIYRFGKNKSGNWAITKDRYIFNGETIDTTISAISIIDDIMWVGFSSTTQGGLFYGTKFSTNDPATDYTSESKYTTTINPSMTASDRGKLKQLLAVQLSFTALASGTTKLEYSVDGSDFAEIFDHTNTAGELVVDATNLSTGEPFDAGREFQFRITSTGKSKIKELVYRYDNLNSLIS